MKYLFFEPMLIAIVKSRLQPGKQVRGRAETLEPEEGKKIGGSLAIVLATTLTGTHAIDEWSLQICEDGLVVRFQNESIFPPNDSEPSLEFQQILASFYPRFMEIIWENSEDISELRIEGHTSSEGLPQQNLFQAYLHNTELSQDRSRNVMNFVLSLPSITTNNEYMTWSFNNATFAMCPDRAIISRNRTIATQCSTSADRSNDAHAVRWSRRCQRQQQQRRQ